MSADRIVVGNESYSRDYVAAMAAACSVYLREYPQHEHGFCYWAAEFMGAEGEDRSFLYSFIEGARQELPYWRYGEYVTTFPGYNSIRACFVRELRKLLQDKLYAHVGVAAAPPAVEQPLAVRPGTQLARVLEALQSGQSALDVIAAFACCRETAASARIRELRSKYGYNIEARRHQHGKAQRFTYHLIGA